MRRPRYSSMITETAASLIKETCATPRQAWRIVPATRSLAAVPDARRLPAGVSRSLTTAAQKDGDFVSISLACDRCCSATAARILRDHPNDRAVVLLPPSRGLGPLEQFEME